MTTGNIRIRTTKTGRRVAHYWSMQCARWFPMPLAEAEFKIATGAA
jgi:hypothetical protein